MRYRLLLITAAIVLGADVPTKALVVVLSHWMPFRLPDGWSLRVAHNPGVILGLGAGTIAPDVFAVIGAVWIMSLLVIYRRDRSPLRAAGLGLMLGGAIGNVGEHQIFGSVVDWAAPPQPDIVFNLADVAITSGQVLLITLLIASLCTRRGPAAVAQ